MLNYHSYSPSNMGGLSSFECVLGNKATYFTSLEGTSKLVVTGTLMLTTVIKKKTCLSYKALMEILGQKIKLLNKENITV